MNEKKIIIKNTKGIITVHSPYDERLVNIFRSLTNRQWDPDEKAWKVGITSLNEEFIPLVKNLGGFTIVFDKSYEYEYNSMNKKEIKLDLKLKLYKYQEEGVKKLVNNRSFLLADEMGLGKTVQTIAAIQVLGLKNVLIYCPNSLKRQWKEEIEKFTDLTCTVIEGNKLQRQKKWMEKSIMKIVNYENKDDTSKFPWDCVVLDEASRIKNYKTKTFKRIVSIKSVFRWALSGHPIENTVVDLYSIFKFVNPLVFGSYNNFKETFLITEVGINLNGGVFEIIIDYKNLDKMKEEIAPYYLRREKKDVLKELPDVVKEHIYVDLNKNEVKIYNQLVKMTANEIEKIKVNEPFNIIGLIQLMRVLCNGETCFKWSNSSVPEVQDIIREAGYSSSKVKELINLLEELFKEGDDKIIIFSSFVKPLKLLEKELDKKGVKYSSLYGEIKNRDEQISSFKNDKDNRVLLSQTNTGGYGLNLQEANRVIFLNRPWNPATEEQAISRCHRMGQKKTVFVHYILTQGTIEDRVNELLNEKKFISKKVIVENSESLLLKV